MVGSSRMKFWAAAVLGGLLAGSAAAQQPNGPTRAVYVTSQDGNPKVYYVTGLVPPDKLPAVNPGAAHAPLPSSAVKPAAPIVIPPIPTTHGQVSENQRNG